MEGGRAGRSSSRYGGASSTVFTGPVRKWNKKWIHLPNNNPNNKQRSSSNNNNQDSHLLFYKWAPISSNNNATDDDDDDDDDTKQDEPPRRKFKYIPVAVLEELNNEAADVQTDEAKPMETDSHAPAEPSSQTEKPDINDLPVEENQRIAQDENAIPSQKSHRVKVLNLNAREWLMMMKKSRKKPKDQTMNDQ
ncbi:hypothetical protein Tco_0659313 [Tanacetum coccineum]